MYITSYIKQILVNCWTRQHFNDSETKYTNIWKKTRVTSGMWCFDNVKQLKSYTQLLDVVVVGSVKELVELDDASVD